MMNNGTATTVSTVCSITCEERALSGTKCPTLETAFRKSGKCQPGEWYILAVFMKPSGPDGRITPNDIQPLPKNVSRCAVRNFQNDTVAIRLPREVESRDVMIQQICGASASYCVIEPAPSE